MEEFASGKADIATLNKEYLPTTMQHLDKGDVVAKLEEIEEERGALKAQIDALGKKRQGYVSDEIAKQGGAADSLDDKLYSTIKKQAKSKGIEYKQKAPQY